MSATPATWLADEAAPFAKVTDSPEKWSVVADASGRGLNLVTGSDLPACLVAKVSVTSPPSRWNDDPKQALTCCLGGSIIKWLRTLEAFVIPKIPGVGEPRSCVKTNQFAETFTRAKLGPATRFYDKAGNRRDQYEDAMEAYVLLTLRPYCFSGAKGISVKLIGFQPA